MPQIDAPVGYLTVRRDSEVHAVGKAVAFRLQSSGDRWDVRAVGASAVNQAVKAIAIATHIVQEARGLTLKVTLVMESGPDRHKPGETISRITMKAEVS